MRRIHDHARLGLAACALFAGTASADLRCDVPGDAASRAAQRMLQALSETNGVPGMGAAVWRDGAVAWRGCAGLRDVERGLPVEGDTVFRLASVSKLVTVMAAASMVQDGQLDIDAPVGDTLPWLPAAWRAVTVRQLAAHVSGAPHYNALDQATLGRERHATSRDAVALFSDRALLSPPGTAYGYSSWGYTLIGAVIEARSGRHFLDVVRERVTGDLPLGADGLQAPDLASALYRIEDGRPERIVGRDMSYTWPGGGFASSPATLAEFGGRVLRHRIVREDTWSWMVRPMPLAGGGIAREQRYDVGFGWRTSLDNDQRRVAHHAGNIDGGRSILMLWPDHDVASTLLSNASWIASMESNAEMLAAPFLPAPETLVDAPCPASGAYDGRLGDTRFRGEATFRIEQARCIGELTAPGPLADHFASAYAWPGRRLRVVSLGEDGTLARGALVTPFGLYDLRASDMHTWEVPFNAETTLRISFGRASAKQG